jgi:VCBS repeat-containing protein
MTLLPNGEWQYTLNNDHPAVQRLEGPRLDGNGVPIPGSAETIEETFTTTYGTTITVTITGTNDRPFVTGSVGADTALRQSNPDADGHMDWSATTAHGSFTARDIDNNEADSLTLHTAEGGPEATREAGGAYTVAGVFGTYTITPDTDNDGQTTFTWTYALNQNLPDFNGSFTDTVRLWVGDGHGGFTQQDVSVSLSGTNTAPVLTAATAEVREDLALSVSGQMLATDTDTRISGGGKDNLTFSAGTEEDGSYGDVVAGEYGTLFLDAAKGSYEYRLNNANPDVQALADGQSAEDVFWVRVSDGMGEQHHERLVVTVRGTDGAPLLSLNDLDGNAGRGASLHVTEADGEEAGYAGYTARGKAVAYDEDDMDQEGNLTFSFGDDNADPRDNPTTLHVHADGETGATARDGDLGTLVMAEDGTYTFTGNPAAIAKLKPGEKIAVETTVVVTDEHGNIDEAPLRITIAGTNTTPEITFTQPDATEGDKAHGDVAFTGGYAAFDADGHGTSVYISTAGGYATTLEGTYGRLTLNGDGTYT